ncbi:MAG: AGE family epimerase/isomerase [Candidatus Sumerlaeia bacterium]
MRRRDFMLSTAGLGLSASLASCSRIASANEDKAPQPRAIPEKIGGRTLQELRDELRHYLFDIHLPFWDRGGDDTQYGGYMCILANDGKPLSDEKYIWFQGRGIWTLSYAYNRFGKNPKHLESARRARDFMVKHMYAGDGRWVSCVRRDGSPVKGVSGSIYDWTFPAEGLIEFYKAAGNKEDLDLAIASIRAAAAAYDTPDYKGSRSDPPGSRIQGHSMVFVHTLRQLLEIKKEPWSESMQREHVDAVMNRFYDPETHISNENLDHDYRRIEELRDYMMLGHSLETRWMVMFETLRTGDRKLFDDCAEAIKRWIPMGWDYNFEGWGGGAYYVNDTGTHGHGAVFNTKTMWSQAETMIACATVLEYTGAEWAAEYYGRAMDFIRRVFAHEDRPWSLVARRKGELVEGSAGGDGNRKDNYHPPRAMMLCMESLDRMIKNDRRLTPFPRG